MKQTIEEAAFLKYPRLINDPCNPTEDDNSYERKIFIDAAEWALSQQEPIKGIDELDVNHIVLQYLQEKGYTFSGDSVNGYPFISKQPDGMEINLEGILEDFADDLIEGIHTSNIQSDAIEFAQWINDNCQMQNSLPKNEWYYVDKNSERQRLTSEELYTEFQNSKGIKQD